MEKLFHKLASEPRLQKRPWKNTFEMKLLIYLEKVFISSVTKKIQTNNRNKLYGVSKY